MRGSAERIDAEFAELLKRAGCERVILGIESANEKILADFSDDPQAQGLEPMILSLKQLKTRRLLEELEMRADAGQHGLVRKLLGEFPRKLTIHS